MLLGGLLFVLFIVAAPTLDEGLACIMHGESVSKASKEARLRFVLDIDTRQSIGRSVE